MPKKTQIVQNDAPTLTQDEPSDELELKPSAKPVKSVVPTPIATEPESKPVKTKRNYTCMEEHKEVLRQRLVVATQRKQESRDVLRKNK